MNSRTVLTILLVVGGMLALFMTYRLAQSSNQLPTPSDREEIVFWHFWGGADRDVVDDLVKQFNQSQDQYWVKAVAMPGNNLDTKIFLSITGGDPPDLVNQDDPIVADWASRGAILPLDEIAPPAEVELVRKSLFESARNLGTYDDRLFAVCNGLDIRALYYNKTVLDQLGLSPPKTIEDLDNIAKTIAPPGDSDDRQTFGYLPDSRRLWAWGSVFGGSFYDFETQKPTVDSPEILAALKWMTRYSQWYGPDTIAAFRQGDQSLPGKRFPLLPMSNDKTAGRYVLLMDGQWRTRDIQNLINQAKLDGNTVPEFGVCPLPYPKNGRANAGWVNGNFFVVPRGARNSKGAWEFMKFWIGIDNPDLAAEFCAKGGWIPTTNQVSESKVFQEYLEEHPLFRPFVELAASENQFPIPVVPGAPFFKRTVEQAASQAMTEPKRAEEILKKAQQSIEIHLKRSQH